MPRYVLTANAPETKDNDLPGAICVSEQQRAGWAILGNFINRVIVLTHKYFDGIVPAEGQLEDIDKALFRRDGQPEKIADRQSGNIPLPRSPPDYGIRRAGNKYLQKQNRESLEKENPARVETVLNVCLQVCASLAVVMEPFMPFMSEKLSKKLGLGKLSFDKIERNP